MVTLVTQYPWAAAIIAGVAILVVVLLVRQGQH